MVLRVKDGLSLTDIHDAFEIHGFDVKDSSKFTTKDVEDMQRVEPRRQRVVDFVINHAGISAVHPELDPKQWPEGQNVAPPSINCLRTTYKDATCTPETLITDLINLINRVQRHGCKIKYCLKTNEKGELLLCKFKYPMEHYGFTAELDEQNNLASMTRDPSEYKEGGGFSADSLRLIRNHPRLVANINELLVVWRGNTDAQVIKSLRELFRYILKYMMKPESGIHINHNVIQTHSDTTFKICWPIKFICN